ncbi:hypothetical protein TWF730_002570 [Orbilia blumenaviensis]|uniref:Uncharacterized protein n=1 Tax=Orbilia blumenaviensis TaxID=1796055 RepID=A0AAV9UBW1_9PEZI
MQLFIALALGVNIASAAVLAPQIRASRATPVSTLKAPCITQFTVTTSYPPADQLYTTTVYTQWAAIPHDLLCKGCSLEIVTETINESRPPNATVTATTSTLKRIPMCYNLPEHTPEP